MRIEAHVNVPGQEPVNMSGLAQKLNAGDTLRAMVLETTPDEALLRLSGGIVLRARTMETVNLKAGQFVELVVISNEGSTILLETAHTRHMAQRFDSETISDLFASLNIKHDDLNIQLAVELIKNGIPVTRDRMDEAHRLIKNFTGLDAEKAAFLLSPENSETEAARQITSRLPSAETSPDLLARLLDGELKLGHLLGRVQELISGTGSEKAYDVNRAAGDGVLVSTSVIAGKEQVENHGKTAVEVFNGKAELAAAGETGVHIHGEAGANPPLKAVDNMETGKSTEKTASGGTDGNPGDTAVTDAGKEGLAQLVRQSNPTDAGKEGYVAGTGYKTEDFHGKATAGNTEDMPANNASGMHAVKAGSVYEGPEILEEYIEHLFLKIEGDKPGTRPAIISKDLEPAEETLDGDVAGTFKAGKVISDAEKDLTGALGAIKSMVRRNEQYVQVKAETISETVTLINGVIKQLNEINHIGVPYIQLPVNINGHKTTAELFVMKRHKGGKRIDPNNLVMYISLDTKNMGRVETILDVKGKNIDIRLRTEKQQFSDYFKENIGQLCAGFSECGYKLTDVRYAIIDSATPPSKLKKLMLGMAQEAGLERGRVDVRV